MAIMGSSLSFRLSGYYNKAFAKFSLFVEFSLSVRTFGVCGVIGDEDLDIPRFENSYFFSYSSS